MFSKSKVADPNQVSATPQKQSGRPTGASIVCADLTVQGTLISTGEVQVDGRVDGDIRSAVVVVGENAVIRGDLYAEDAKIRGRVEGNIRARKVQLYATCHVEGTILHEAISIEAGAYFEGSCRHSDNPLADAPELAGRNGGARPSIAPPVAS